jgi:hypothetical protein
MLGGTGLSRSGQSSSATLHGKQHFRFGFDRPMCRGELHAIRDLPSVTMRDDDSEGFPLPLVAGLAAIALVVAFAGLQLQTWGVCLEDDAAGGLWICDFRSSAPGFALMLGPAALVVLGGLVGLRGRALVWVAVLALTCSVAISSVIVASEI